MCFAFFGFVVLLQTALLVECEFFGVAGFDVADLLVEGFEGSIGRRSQFPLSVELVLGLLERVLQRAFGRLETVAVFIGPRAASQTVGLQLCGLLAFQLRKSQAKIPQARPLRPPAFSRCLPARPNARLWIG